MEQMYKCFQCTGDEPCTLTVEAATAKPTSCPYARKNDTISPLWVEYETITRPVVK